VAILTFFTVSAAFSAVEKRTGFAQTYVVLLASTRVHRDCLSVWQLAAHTLDFRLFSWSTRLRLQQGLWLRNGRLLRRSSSSGTTVNSNAGRGRGHPRNCDVRKSDFAIHARI
jgi:hypothetical protein